MTTLDTALALSLAIQNGELLARALVGLRVDADLHDVPRVRGTVLSS